MRVVSSRVHKTGVTAAVEHIVLPLLCILAIALFTGLFFTRYLSNDQSYYSSSHFGCAPDGNPTWPWASSTSGRSYSSNEYWNPSLFLSLTLAAGELTFTQAKAVDIIWDFFVGRGGQLLLAVLAYPVLRKSLLTWMEQSSVRTSLVTTLTFERTSLESLWTVMKNMKKSWSWRLLAYLWIILYLLTFGTIVSAMTGYQANMVPYYTATDGSLVPSDSINKTTGYVVSEPRRVGLAPIEFNSPGIEAYEAYGAVWQYDTQAFKSLELYTDLNYYDCGDYFSRDAINATVGDNGTFRDAGNPASVSIDWIAQPGTMWRDGSYHNYSAPQDRAFINCTASSIDMGDQTYNLSYPMLDVIEQSLYIMPDGTLMHQDSFERNSQCQILKTYQWGFSSLLLFTFCIFTIVYALALQALHVDIWLNSATDRVKQDFTLYRDILDHAHEIKVAVDGKIEGLPAKQLQKRINGDDGAISISAYEYPPSRFKAFRRSDSRLRRLGTDLKACHAYSWAETKRAWGFQYGPVWKQPKYTAHSGKPPQTYEEELEEGLSSRSSRQTSLHSKPPPAYDPI